MTPRFFPNIAERARASVGAGLQALKAARGGELAFSLMRPPGHHATRHRAMGFCYLNAVAIATLEALATGAKRVAVYDFDVHHGNGTEAILLNKPGAAFYSIHQFPCYPGTGARNVGDNCYNYPVPPKSPRQEYRKILSGALDQLKKIQTGPGRGFSRLRCLLARPIGRRNPGSRGFFIGWANPSPGLGCRFSACWKAATAMICLT